MAIRNMYDAVHIAKDRAKRTQETICIVQIGENEYILWREESISNMPLVYEYYRILGRVDKDGNITR